MGFANLLMSLHKDRGLDYVVFALEGQNNHRKKLYPQYKANRNELPQDAILQLPIAMEWIEKVGLKSIKVDGYEADDVIASLAQSAIEPVSYTHLRAHETS